MSECVGRDTAALIMNQKMPNKHFLPQTRSYSFNDEKNEWLREEYHNFYFCEGEDSKVYYFNAEDGKNFFYESSE